jgi:hypothetical protein
MYARFFIDISTKTMISYKGLITLSLAVIHIIHFSGANDKSNKYNNDYVILYSN